MEKIVQIIKSQKVDKSSLLILLIFSTLGYTLVYIGYIYSYLKILIGITGVLLLYMIFRKPVVGVYLILFFLFNGIQRAATLAKFHPTIFLGFFTFSGFLILILYSKIKIHIGEAEIFISLFGLSAAISLIFARNFQLALRSFIEFLLAVAFYFLIKHFVTSRNELVNSIKIISFSIFVGAFVNIIYLYTSGNLFTVFRLGGIYGRMESFGYDPNYWAILLNLGIVLTYYLYRNANRVGFKLLYIIFIATFISSLLLTYSRAGLLTFFVIFSIIVFKRAKWSGILILVVSLAITIFMIIYLPFLGRFKTILLAATTGVSDTSLRDRANLLTLAFKLLSRNPIFGIGLDNFKEFSTIVSNIGKRVHNTYLEILIDTGILGFIFYIMIFIKVLTRKVTMYVEEASFLKLGLIVFLIENLALSIPFFAPMWAILGLLECKALMKIS